MTEPEGVAARILDRHVVTGDDARSAILRRAPARGEIPTGALPYTPRASAVLEHTSHEALELGHQYIGTDHLLLALCAGPTAAATRGAGLRRGGGLAAEVLTELGLDRNAARASVIEVLSGYPR